MAHAKKGDLLLVEVQHSYHSLTLAGAYAGYVTYELASVEKATRDGKAIKGKWANGTVKSVRDAKTTCYVLPPLGLPLAELEERVGKALEDAGTLEQAKAIFREAFPTPPYAGKVYATSIAETRL